MGVTRKIVDTLVRKETPEANAISGFFGGIKNKLLEEPGRALAADQAASANRQKEIKANYKRPGYDQTPLEKTRRTAANAAWDPATSKEPVSPVISRENRQGVVGDKLSLDRFNPNKLTLGNGPDGQVGMFKDGQMQEPGSVRLSGGNLGGTPLPAGQSPFFMKSQAAQGLVPQPGTASAIPGMQQNPVVTNPGGNMTALLDQDTAMFTAQMDAAKRGDAYGFAGSAMGGVPQIPGGAPQQGDRNYRDLENQIANLTRTHDQILNPSSYGDNPYRDLLPTTRMNMAAQIGDQIKGLNDTLFHRSSLSNDIVKALIGANSAEKTTGMVNDTTLKTQGMKSDTDIYTANVEANATLGSQVYKNERQDKKDNQKMNIDSLQAEAKILSERRKANGSLSPEDEEKEKTIMEKLSRISAATGGQATAALPGNTSQLN